MLRATKLAFLVALPLLFSAMAISASAQENDAPSLCEVLINKFWCPDGVINCLRDRFGATGANPEERLTSCKDTFNRLLREERGVVVSVVVTNYLLREL